MNDERKPSEGETPQQKQELAAYEKLREEARRLLSEIRDTVNAEAIRDVVDKATDRLRQAGGYTAEALDKAGKALRKDLASAAEKLGPKWEAFSEKTADLFGVWRDRGGVFLGQASHAVGVWLEKAGLRLMHQVYRTGEMTSGGTFECASCRNQTVLSGPGYLPPCHKCNGTEFRRI